MPPPSGLPARRLPLQGAAGRPRARRARARERAGKREAPDDLSWWCGLLRCACWLFLSACLRGLRRTARERAQRRRSARVRRVVARPEPALDRSLPGLSAVAAVEGAADQRALLLPEVGVRLPLRGHQGAGLRTAGHE